MKRILFIIISLIISKFCCSQETANEFCGIIKYKIEIESVRPDKLDSYIASSGTMKIMYYSKGRFKFETYLDDVLLFTNYQFVDSNYNYVRKNYENSISAYSEPNIEDEPTEIIENNKLLVLGHDCDKVTYKFKDAIAERFYSNDFVYTINPKPESNVFFRSYSKINSPPLKYVFNVKGYKTVTYIATEIKEVPLDDTIFRIPKEKIIYDPEPEYFSVISYRTIADKFMEINKNLEAISLYNRAINYYKYDYDGIYNRALCYLKTDNLLSACEDFEFLKKKKDKQAIDLFNKLCNCKELKPYYYRELQSCILNNEYDRSITYFDLIIQCNPNDTNAIFNRAISKYNSNQRIEAFEDILLCMNQGDSKAYEFVSKNYNKQSLSNAYYKIGNKFFSERNYQKSVEYFTYVLNNFPESALVLRKRGQSYLKLKNKDKACEDFSKAMNLKDDAATKLYKKKCR